MAQTDRTWKVFVTENCDYIDNIIQADIILTGFNCEEQWGDYKTGFTLSWFFISFLTLREK